MPDIIGTLLNTAGIVLGTLFGLLRREPLSATTQSFFKMAVGIATVFIGLRLTVMSLNGSFLQVVKQLAVVMLAMMLGKLVGRLLRMQKGSNQLGRRAREKIEKAATAGDTTRFNDGFFVCSILFCAAPLGIVGAVTEGVSGYFSPLGVKAIMDALGAAGFVAMFGWGVIWSAVPVLIFQGTITLVCARFLLPVLERHDVVDPVIATAGLLIFSVSLIIFDVKKIHVTDYLPSLALAPVLSLLFR